MLHCLCKKERAKLESGKAGKFIHRWEKIQKIYIITKTSGLSLTEIKARMGNVKLRKVSFPTHRQLKFSYSLLKITRLFLRSQESIPAQGWGWDLNDL